MFYVYWTSFFLLWGFWIMHKRCWIVLLTVSVQAWFLTRKSGWFFYSKRWSVLSIFLRMSKTQELLDSVVLIQQHRSEPSLKLFWLLNSVFWLPTFLFHKNLPEILWLETLLYHENRNTLYRAHTNWKSRRYDLTCGWDPETGVTYRRRRYEKFENLARSLWHLHANGKLS